MHCQENFCLQVYDISAEDGANPSFEFVQSSQYWEVPISGQGQPENPVPAADGRSFQVTNFWYHIAYLHNIVMCHDYYQCRLCAQERHMDVLTQPVLHGLLSQA